MPSPRASPGVKGLCQGRIRVSGMQEHAFTPHVSLKLNYNVNANLV